MEEIMDTAETIKSAIKAISELEIIGDPLWVIAFNSDSIDIYKVMDQMTQKGWNLNGLH